MRHEIRLSYNDSMMEAEIHGVKFFNYLSSRVFACKNFEELESLSYIVEHVHNKYMLQQRDSEIISKNILMDNDYRNKDYHVNLINIFCAYLELEKQIKSKRFYFSFGW